MTHAYRALAIAAAVALTAPAASAQDAQLTARLSVAFGAADWGLRLNGRPITAPAPPRLQAAAAADSETGAPRVYWGRLALALVAVGIVYAVTRERSDAFAYDRAPAAE